MQVMSQISEELADCTICQGIELSDGSVIGAIADVDLFGAFTVDMEEAVKVVNKANGTKLRARGDLWEVGKRRESRFDNTVEKETKIGKIGVDELARRAAAGLDIWTGKAIQEDTEESEDDNE
jgi:hypothetical protein